MGMSASQARLLTLTARMSDLELKAQSISNSKLRLSVQSEDVSRAYSDSLNKERLSMLTGSNSSTATYSDLSYALLCGQNNLTQYGLSTTGGGILVSKDMESKFKKSADLDEFLVNCGQESVDRKGHTQAEYTAAYLAVNGGTDAQNNTVVGAEAAYATAQDNTNAAHADLINYGVQYVKGYNLDKLDGSWSYSQVDHSNFTYSDSQIFNYLSSSSNGLSAETADGTTVPYSSNPSTGSAVNYGTLYNGANELPVLVADVCADATAALRSTMSGVDSTKFSQAVTTAIANTQSHYGNAQTNWLDANTSNYLGSNEIAVDRTRSATSPPCYVDSTQMVKTFLDYFDQAFGSTTGSVGTPSGNGTGSTPSTTTRGQANGVEGSTISYDVTNHYSSANGDPVKFTATTDSDGKNTATEYARLQNVYDGDVTAEGQAKTTLGNAKTRLSDVTPVYTAKEDSDVDYYTNLYNRMCDGYSTVRDADENKTLNNADWIQNQIINGNLLIEKVDSSGNWNKISWESDTSITKGSDDTDTARAEAQYSVATAEIQTKDKKFDLELQNIETEHTAVQTEVDSVKKVIDKNIERSFKNFNA